MFRPGEVSCNNGAEPPVSRCLILSLGIAWQTVSPEVARHAAAGVTAQKEGHLAEAIGEFKRVTELAPELAVAWVNLGSAYMQNNDYGAAIEPLKKALALDSSLGGAEQMLGYALLAQGYAAEAMPHLERTQSLGALGIAQLDTGKLAEAITNLETELAKRPGDPDLIYYLAKASGLLSKQSFDTLLASYPDSARAHQALGENYAGLRRVPEAEREYREALRLKPNAPGLHLALGDLYAQTMQWPKAEEEFRFETKLQPGNAEAAFGLGNALLQRGEAKMAVAELLRAEGLRPDMPETLYALGKAQSLTGDLAGAEKAWKRVIALEENSSLAAQSHFGLAALYRKQGKAVDAEREMQAFRRLQTSGTPHAK